MKITKKGLFTTVSLFVFLAVVPMSCNLFCAADTCGCGPIPSPPELRVKTFATQLVNPSDQEISNSEIKPYDQAFVSLRINEVEYIKQSSIEKTPSAAFGTALACSPAPALTENTLYLVQIINEKEFTDSEGILYSVGENITSLFGMSHFFAPGLTTVKNFTIQGKRLTLDDYFKIGFLENPEKELNLEFSIRLRFDDAQEFLLTDQILNVQ